jgi:threonine/homoserine/homoserine lactone efflux protein
LFTAIKIAGVCYLLYLAWQSLKSDGALSVTAMAKHESAWQIARRGALINILNPKLSIFFLALLPPFLSGNTATATAEITILGIIFMVMTFAVFILYGCFAAAARKWLLGSARVMRWLNRSFAAIFTALAGRLALERA